MDEGKSIEIKIVITPSKLAELIKLMPDHAKGRGEKTRIIYWFIDEGMRAAIAKSQQEPRQYHGSNRDYLRRN
jgi:hypothetical protein